MKIHKNKRIKRAEALKRITTWIDLLIAKPTCISPALAFNDNNAVVKNETYGESECTYTSTHFLNKFIYTHGDCLRFALLLMASFPQYNPQLYLVRDGKSHHFYVYILGVFVDACGIHDFKDADLKGIIEPFAAAKLGISNMEHMRVFAKMIEMSTFEFHNLKFQKLDTAHPVVCGMNYTWVDCATHLFRKISKEDDFVDYVTEINERRMCLDLDPIMRIRIPKQAKEIAHDKNNSS